MIVLQAALQLAVISRDIDQHGVCVSWSPWKPLTDFQVIVKGPDSIAAFCLEVPHLILIGMILIGSI